MTVTWRFGLRNVCPPGSDDQRRVLHALWELSPKHDEDGNCIRDVQWIRGAPEMFEVEGGRYRRTPEALATEIFDAITRGDGYASWNNELAADYHEGVGELGVPWLIPTASGNVDSLRVELPILGARTLQYIRVQCRWVSIDEDSELLIEHGLTRNDAFRMNHDAIRLSDIAMQYGLLMTYG